MGRLRGTFGTGEIRSSLAPGTAITALPPWQLSGCPPLPVPPELAPDTTALVMGLSSDHRHQAFVVAGLFVVVFVFLVDFWWLFVWFFFLNTTPINMHVQGGILGYSFSMVCLGGTGFSE